MEGAEFPAGADYYIHNPLLFVGQDLKLISVFKKMNRSTKMA